MLFSTQIIYNKKIAYQLRLAESKKINTQQEAIVTGQISSKEGIWRLNLNQVLIAECKEIPE